MTIRDRILSAIAEEANRLSRCGAKRSAKAVRGALAIARNVREDVQQFPRVLDGVDVTTTGS